MVARETLLRDVLPRAEAAAEATVAGYASGASSLVAVVDAQRALYEIRLEAERARVDVCRWYARLMRAAGLTLGQEELHPSDLSARPIETDNP